MRIKEKLKLHYVNYRGVRIPDKVVIFESDDWGAIRSTGSQGVKTLKEKGYQVEKCAYSKFDSIESNNDVELLLTTLDSFSAAGESKPKFTLNNIVANPDFGRIETSDFEEYYYEPFTRTLGENDNSNRVMTLYKEGLNNNLIQPQFHGREHVHVHSWMNDLKQPGTIARDCFNLNMVSAHKNDNHDCRNEYLSSHVITDETSKAIVLESIVDGLDLFEKIWGFRSLTSISPCYFWNQQVEDVLYKNGIKAIQSGRVQFIHNTHLETRRHYFGEKNKNNQVYLLRNAFFEPSLKRTSDPVGTCLSQIKLAFDWSVPAIISTHRVNYIGVHNERNRVENILSLKVLINSIITKWPDVKFMTSDELYKTYLVEL